MFSAKKSQFLMHIRRFCRNFCHSGRKNSALFSFERHWNWHYRRYFKRFAN